MRGVARGLLGPGSGSWSVRHGTPGARLGRFRSLRRAFGHTAPGAASAKRRSEGLQSRGALREAGPFDGEPGAEEAVQGGLVAEDAKRDAAGLPHHAAGEGDQAVEEAPELHRDVLGALALAREHEGEPGLQVPGQGGDDQVGPVADEVVERDPQGTHAVLELLDDVLLITALIRTAHDRLRAQIPARGDGEEVADLVEEDVLALALADVLAHHDDPVGAAALAGLILELGHVLMLEPEVQVAPLPHDARLLVLLRALAALAR